MMRKTTRAFRGRARPATTVLCILLVPISAFAHAILLEAEPAAKSEVVGPDVPVKLKFNSRIDGRRSKLTLVLPDSSTQPIALDHQPSENVLVGSLSRLKSGGYKIRWQVLATDGHITRGEFAFSVK